MENCFRIGDGSFFVPWIKVRFIVHGFWYLSDNKGNTVIGRYKMNRRMSITEIMGLGSRLELYGVLAAFAVAVVIVTYGALL